MSSKTNKNYREDSRLKPTCTRCRNHGIYFVPLKGHRNVCPFKLCDCQDCALILERRQVVIKPQRRTGISVKSNGRKRTSKEREDRNTGKDDGALTDAFASVRLPPSLSKRKEPIPNNITARRNQELSKMHQYQGNASPNLLKSDTRFLPECANLTNPPLSYGYSHCPPGVQNFHPGAHPSMLVNMPSLQRMMVPEHPNWMLGYPTLSPYSALYHQGFVMDSNQMDVGTQSPSVLY